MTFHPAPIVGPQGEAGSPDTPEQVRTKVGDAPDSNVYTDAEKAAVATIEDKITDADLQTAIGAIELPASEAGNEIFLNFDTDDGGWNGFLFAANQSISVANGQLTITRVGTGSASSVDSRNVDWDFVVGQDYVIEVDVASINVADPTGTWELKNAFSANPGESVILQVGTNELEFTHVNVSGQVPTILTRSTSNNTAAGDSIVINSITISDPAGAPSIRNIIDEQVANAFQTIGVADLGLENVANIAPADYPVSTAQQAAIDEVAGMLGIPESLTLDFDTGDEGWNGTLFAANQSFSVANGQLTITRVDTGSASSLDSRNIDWDFVVGERYTIVVNVASINVADPTGSWVIKNAFSSSSGQQTELVVGENELTFTHEDISGQVPAIIGRNDGGTADGDSIVIESIVVSDVAEAGEPDGPSFDPTLDYVWIGNGAENTRFDSGVNAGVLIGRNAITNQTNSVVIGHDADGVHEPAYGSLGIHGCQTNNEMVIVGNLAAGGGWRTTALGAKAMALGQSSTALGAGSVSLASHGVALGRGAWVPDQSQLSFIGAVIGASSLYLENGWGHSFNTPISGIGVGNRIPSTVVAEYHGQDAFDARYPLWSPTVNYPASNRASTSAVVQDDNGNVYKSLAASGPNTSVVEPGVTTGWEDFWRFVYLIRQSGSAGPGGPGDYNVDGGHGRLIAGRPTGSGVGGTAGLSVADGANIGQNRKQKIVEAVYADSDTGNANTHLCLRRDDGTEVRVNIEADGTLKVVPRTSLNLTYRSNANQTQF